MLHFREDEERPSRWNRLSLFRRMCGFERNLVKFGEQWRITFMMFWNICLLSDCLNRVKEHGRCSCSERTYGEKEKVSSEQGLCHDNLIQRVFWKKWCWRKFFLEKICLGQCVSGSVRRWIVGRFDRRNSSKTKAKQFEPICHEI